MMVFNQRTRCISALRISTTHLELDIRARKSRVDGARTANRLKIRFRERGESEKLIENSAMLQTGKKRRLPV